MRQNKKYEMLKEFGIGEPVLSELVNKNGLDDDFIKFHVRAAKEDKISPGLLIHRIRSGDKPRKIYTMEEDYRRYLEGPCRVWGCGGGGLVGRGRAEQARTGLFNLRNISI